MGSWPYHGSSFFFFRSSSGLGAWTCNAHIQMFHHCDSASLQASSHVYSRFQMRLGFRRRDNPCRRGIGDRIRSRNQGFSFQDSVHVRRGSWRDDEDMGSTWYLRTQQKLIAVFDQPLNFAGQNILHPPSIDRSDCEIRMVIDIYTARLQVQRLLITFQTWY